MQHADGKSKDGKQQHKEFSKSVLSKESGVNIYETNIDPIKWDDNATQAKKVIREDIKNVEGAALLHNVLTESECEQLVQVSEELGYTKALVTTSRGMVEDEMRTNKRVIWQTSVELLNKTVWQRIKEKVPDKISITGKNTFHSCGLNERIRFYRYTGGERFAPHYDGAFFRNRSDIERSFFTIIIYLNDDPERVGGETSFFFRPKGLAKGSFKTTRIETFHGRTTMGVNRVAPKTGAALIFYHSHPLSPLHEGSMIAKGSKYVLRSDIMFRQEGYEK